MSRASEAIARANAVLELLDEIDELILDVSHSSMAQTFERVLTNNAPAGARAVTHLDLDEMPESYRKRVHTNKYLTYVSGQSPHDNECEEEGEDGYLPCETVPKDNDMFRAYISTLMSMRASRDAHVFEYKYKFNPCPWIDNYIAAQNYIRPDLRDLYGIEIFDEVVNDVRFWDQLDPWEREDGKI